MKFFLDTASLTEIREGAKLGIIDGITTNPSLAAKEGRAFKDIILEICSLIDGPISAEVTTTEAEAMIEQARELRSWHRNIVVKIPLTREGIRAMATLRTENTRINVTLVFSPSQAILAAKAGATYVSPFLGRLDDISHVGMEVVRDIVTIYRQYGFETQVLAASLRHPLHVVEAAKAGAHVATMPFKVFEMLFKHPLTDRGLEAFLKDWEKARQTLGEIIPEAVPKGSPR
ncbi:MAG TPA: fructose-6-phosphate aldolase [Candidatus Acidoferrales bacterium]